MQIEHNVRVPMRDGITLALDYYLPEGQGPWPVVLERTPYGKTLHSRSEIDASGRKISRLEMAQAFVDAGMAVAYQDVRGRYNSEGTFTKYVNEAADGYDTLDWIVKQRWCDGSIGTMGLSYAAHTQLAAAGLNPPGLAAMVLDSGGFDNAYLWGIRQGGAFELKQATWAYKQSQALNGVIADPKVRRAELERWFSSMPWSEGNTPVSDYPEYEKYLLEQWRSGEFDEYWKKPGLYNEPFYEDIPDIPIMFMSSWYDVYVPSTLHNYRELSRRDSPHQLIMGPWLHGDRVLQRSGNADFGPDAVFDGNVASSWLDHRVTWLRSVLVGKISPDSSVHVFEMGGGAGPIGDVVEHGGRWITASSWPLPSTRTTTLALGADGSLSCDPAGEGSVELVADPDNPVPMIGGQATSGEPIFAGGGFNQVESPNFFGTDGSNRSLAQREDVLVFETEPLDKDIVIAGSVKAHIAFIASTFDFDICVKLVDVYPLEPGQPEFALNITDSIKRARYRHSFEDPTLVTPGEQDYLEVVLPETCNRFVRGHRIRLEIAGSNFPHFDVNPNSGEAEGYADNKTIARTRILCGSEGSILNVDVLAQTDSSESEVSPEL